VRVGILGGTFNPPHLGHLVCAQEAYVQLELDRVLLVPAGIPPHKANEEEPGVEHRLAMCRLSIRGDEHRFAVSEIEVRRPGPSYTVDTLEELSATTPDIELFLILGGDIAAGLPNWHRIERVLELATAVVAERRGTPRASIEDALESVRAGERGRFFPMPPIGLSSTMIRERVRAGQPIKYLVPDAVDTYVQQHTLYQGVANIDES
jgi:nicotinate-nucleotide adenylyltransferase